VKTEVKSFSLKIKENFQYKYHHTTSYSYRFAQFTTAIAGTPSRNLPTMIRRRLHSSDSLIWYKPSSCRSLGDRRSLGGSRKRGQVIGIFMRRPLPTDGASNMSLPGGNSLQSPKSHLHLPSTESQLPTPDPLLSRLLLAPSPLARGLDCRDAGMLSPEVDFLFNK